MFKKFWSYEDYEAWTGKFDECSEYQMTPIVIDNGRKIAADMFTVCKSWKTAVRRFTKTFSEIPEIAEWTESMKESCESGMFKDSYCEEDYNHAFSWGVEEYDGNEWYVFLNISGVYADR